MKPLRILLHEYKKQGKALGHFNFSDSNQLHALALTVKETGLPLVVGLSEGERDYFPMSHAKALVDVYREHGLPIYLNADHTYSLEKAKKAIDDGVDSVVVDGAKLSFDQNVTLVRDVVHYAHKASSWFSGRDVLVEGELGYIGQSSTVMDELPEGAAASEEMMTKADELAKLVKETNMDLAAPAVGNIHGVVTSGQPKLSISKIKELSTTAGVPLVLHGGSGSSDQEFSEAISAGIAMIHINTDLRLIYRDALRESLAGSETTPYKFLNPAVEKMKNYLMQKVRLFAKI